jgi:hypothetical protein
MVLRSGTGRIEELKLMPVNVLLISAFTASNGVSSLYHVRDSSKDLINQGTYKSVMVCFNTDTLGKEALRLVMAFRKSVGRVTFWSASRLGMLN